MKENKREIVVNSSDCHCEPRRESGRGNLTRSVTLNVVQGLSGVRYEILRFAQDDLSGQIASPSARNDSGQRTNK